MNRRIALLLVALTLLSGKSSAYDAEQLYFALRNKVQQVKDYTANVKMKVDITYMKIPTLRGTLYFKAPDKMRMERHGGISIMPKRNINLTLSNLIPVGKVNIIDAGEAEMHGRKVRVLKVIPEDDQADIVLTKIWIDETNIVALRTETTTKNEGTVVMDLEYSRYISYALPDKVTVTMDVKNYKLPKGATMDYSEGPEPQPKTPMAKERKGTIEITYLDYQINTGLNDSVFLTKEE